MTPAGRRATGWAALAAGLCALAAAAVLLLRPAAPPADAGVLPPVVAPSSAPAAPAPAPAATLDQRWTPTRLTIGGLDVDAPVRGVGVTRDGFLDVPANPDRLGWWFGSALPGDDRGTVLIAGHVDTAEDGKGVLYRLERLPIGARIEVRAGDRTVAYRVTARRSYAKSALPDELFRRDTAPRLALVTCGGAFRNGTYDHNVVVYAEGVAPAPRGSRSA